MINCYQVGDDLPTEDHPNTIMSLDYRFLSPFFELGSPVSISFDLSNPLPNLVIFNVVADPNPTSGPV